MKKTKVVKQNLRKRLFICRNEHYLTYYKFSLKKLLTNEGEKIYSLTSLLMNLPVGNGEKSGGSLWGSYSCINRACNNKANRVSSM